MAGGLCVVSVFLSFFMFLCVLATGGSIGVRRLLLWRRLSCSQGNRELLRSC